MEQANRVFLNPQGYIEIVLVGDQTEASFRQVYNEAMPLIDQLQKDGKPLLGLIDMTRQTGYSIDSDKAALELLESLTYDRLVMCNPPHAGVAQGIILAMGRTDNTKVFKDRGEAETWLLNG